MAGYLYQPLPKSLRIFDNQFLKCVVPFFPSISAESRSVRGHFKTTAHQIPYHLILYRSQYGTWLNMYFKHF